MPAPCECENINHFSRPEDSGIAVHPYGRELPVRPVKTEFGTFNVCPECAATCLKDFILNPEVPNV